MEVLEDLFMMKLKRNANVHLSLELFIECDPTCLSCRSILATDCTDCAPSRYLCQLGWPMLAKCITDCPTDCDLNVNRNGTNTYLNQDQTNCMGKYIYSNTL